MAEIGSLSIFQHNDLSWKTHDSQKREMYRSLNPQIILINGHGCKKEEEELKMTFIYKGTKGKKGHSLIRIRMSERSHIYKGTNDKIGQSFIRVKRITKGNHL